MTNSLDSYQIIHILIYLKNTYLYIIYTQLHYLEVKNTLHAMQKQFKSSQPETASYHTQIISNQLRQ